MPKNKTHKGTAKRIKVSSKGKLQRQMCGRRHRLEVKPSTLTRKLEGTVVVAPADAPRIKRLLGR
jgi:large subunit ribosomal protein L35